MMIIFYFLLALILSVMQTTVLAYLNFHGGVANIILILAIILLYYKYENWALLFICISGVFLDLLSSTPKGAFFVSLVLVFYIIRYLYDKFLSEASFHWLLLSVIFASLLLDIIFLLYIKIFGYQNNWLYSLNIIIFDLVANVVIFLIIYPIFLFFNGQFSARHRLIRLKETR